HPTIEYIFNATFYSQSGLVKVHDGYISSENRRVERIHYAGEFYAGGEKNVLVRRHGDIIDWIRVDHRNYYFDYLMHYDPKTSSINTTNVMPGLKQWFTTTPSYHPAIWMSVYRPDGDAIARLWINDYKNWTFTELQYSRDMTAPPPHDTPPGIMAIGTPVVPTTKSDRGGTDTTTNSWYTLEIYPYFAQSSGANIYRILPKNTEVAANYYFWVHKGENNSAEETKSVTDLYTAVTKPMTIRNYSASPIYKIAIKGVEAETTQAVSVDPSSVVPYPLSIEVIDYRTYNPDFEINNSGYAHQDSSSGDKSFAWDSNKKHSGNYAVKITDNDNTGKGMWYTDPLIPGVVADQNYSVSVWIYLEGNGPGGASLVGEWYSGSGIEEKNRTKTGITSPVVNTTGEWVELTAIGTAPKGATDLRINLTIENWNGSVWFDDLEVDRRVQRDCVVINPQIADPPPANDDMTARNGYAHLQSDGINTVYNRNTSIGRGDSKSLEIVSFDGSKAVWYTMPQVSNTIPGRNYTIGAWVYLEGGGAGGAYIYGEWYNGSKTENYTGFAGKSETANTVGEWILLTAYGIAPLNAMELRVNLAIENWVGRVLFDGLSVRVLDDGESVTISMPTMPNNWNISVVYNGTEITKNGTSLTNVTFYNIDDSGVALLVRAPQIGDNGTVNATVNFTLNALNLTQSYNFRFFVDIRYSVNLSCNDVVRFVRKGDNTTFVVIVTNAGNVNDTYNITPAQIVQKEGWNITADKSNVTLAPGESETVNIVVTPPFNIPPDDEMIIDIIAQSRKNAGAVKRLPVIVYGNTMKNISVVCIDRVHYVYPGNKTAYTIYVINNGYNGDTITFDELITSPGWNATLDKMSVTLGNETGNNSATITLEVTVSENYSLAKAGYEERTRVIGKSTLMKGLRDITDATTIVNRVFDIRILNITNNTKPDVNATVGYSVAVYNAGNGEDFVNVTVYIPHLLRDYTGVDKDFIEYIPQVKIEQDEIKLVNFLICIPPWAAEGRYRGVVNASNGHPSDIVHPEDNYSFSITIKRKYIGVIGASRYTDEENKIIEFNRTPAQSITLPDPSTTVTITNKGNGPDIINVKVVDHPDWITFDENSTLLGPGGSKVLGMKINIPENVPAGIYNITALCWSSNDTIANASFITFRINVRFIDLLLPSDGVSISPQKLSTGDVVTITAKVVNNGTIDATDVRVLLMDNGKVFDNVSIGKISPNGSSDANFIWKAQDGSHNIQIKVNPDNLPREYNTTNNNFATSVFVVGATYLWWTLPLILISIIVVLFIYITWKKRSKEEEF
ncbi:MAG: CARDB domain-containing protein, partial [Thermoplasmata archaeon]